MQRICTSLANNGFEVLLVGRCKKKSIALEQQNFAQKRLNCRFENGMLFYMEYNIRLLFYLLKNKVDIISSVDVDTILPCLIASKIKAKKIVFDAHEYYSQSPEIVNRPVIKKVWEIISKYCIPKVDVAYTVGPMLAKLMSQDYNIAFGCIRNVPLRQINTTIKNQSSQPIILYQGALNKGRGLEESIQAMQQINAELWLAGDGDLMQELQQLVSNLMLKNKVKFLGYIKPNDLKNITSKAYIGLNLLQPIGLSYYYSLANKFFDYIQQGIPCVTANFPEYEAINNTYNCCVPCPCNVSEIAFALNQLLYDKNYYTLLQQNCLQAKDVLCWQCEENSLIEIYKPLAN